MPRVVKAMMAPGDTTCYDHWKAPGFEHYLTCGQLSAIVGVDNKWVKVMEQRGEIPAPIRVAHGKVKVRLYSPEHAAKVVAFFEARNKNSRRRRR